ncbi:hypothetical protein FISHEDRAFT_73404 [Fistulina hepatica ATCC 64428]|uniref:Uncharacterized protein n=1 Tax=Fistulina hepatica ATCC 64428 TaxID=1128425 RepID=A0A0D7AFJ0_9AGAR|nr:hypothetical protein FISHEDRAFT_73404 [Fistulina hepatica ATCC 64428]
MPPERDTCYCDKCVRKYGPSGKPNVPRRTQNDHLRRQQLANAVPVSTAFLQYINSLPAASGSKTTSSSTSNTTTLCAYLPEIARQSDIPANGTTVTSTQVAPLVVVSPLRKVQEDANKVAEPDDASGIRPATE